MNTTDQFVERLEKIEVLLEVLIKQHQSKEYYSTAEVAEILGKAEWTVRNWCNLARINAEKRPTGRGLYREWKISHRELVRIQCDGLLPPPHRC